MSWTTVLVIAAGAYAFKALGSVLGRRLTDSAGAQRVLMLLPPALLSALVLVGTFDGGERLVLDARVIGVGVGAIAAWRKAPFAIVVVLAAAVTAGARALA